MIQKALVGYTGFVGKNLMLKGNYDALYNSKNSKEMRGRHFSEVVCAGVSAVKWKANKDPLSDWEAISNLIDNINCIQADYFVLISTVDVYQRPDGVNESDPVSEVGEAYGVNRAKLECFVREKFDHYLIIRLPALYGTGLRKNAIYDLQNDNMVERIDPLSVFQWYDVRRLEMDLATIRAHNLNVVNVSSEPIEMRAIADQYFPGKLRVHESTTAPLRYDMRTLHPSVLGGNGYYHFSRSQVLNGIGNYLEEKA